MGVDVPRLEAGELHIWRASVDLGAEAAAELERCLSADERERAMRRRYELDRRRYIAARGVLRTLLAGYTGVDAADLCLAYGPQGKPEIAPGPPSTGGVRFNVSHSGSLAIFAFSRGAAVGVDMERVRPVPHAERVAHRVFPTTELRSWLELPAEQRLEGFFTRWTQLEAIAKLHGGGVWWLVRQGGTLPDEPGLTVLDLAAPPGYLAAAAVARRVTTLIEMSYPHPQNTTPSSQ